MEHEENKSLSRKNAYEKKKELKDKQIKEVCRLRSLNISIKQITRQVSYKFEKEIPKSTVVRWLNQNRDKIKKMADKLTDEEKKEIAEREEAKKTKKIVEKAKEISKIVEIKKKEASNEINEIKEQAKELSDDIEKQRMAIKVNAPVDKPKIEVLDAEEKPTSKKNLQVEQPKVEVLDQGKKSEERVLDKFVFLQEHTAKSRVNEITKIQKRMKSLERRLRFENGDSLKEIQNKLSIEMALRKQFMLLCNDLDKHIREFRVSMLDQVAEDTLSYEDLRGLTQDDFAAYLNGDVEPEQMPKEVE